MITLTQGLLLALMAFLVGFDDLMEAFSSCVRSWWQLLPVLF